MFIDVQSIFSNNNGTGCRELKMGKRKKVRAIENVKKVVRAKFLRIRADNAKAAKEAKNWNGV